MLGIRYSGNTLLLLKYFVECRTTCRPFDAFTVTPLALHLFKVFNSNYYFLTSFSTYNANYNTTVRKVSVQLQSSLSKFEVISH
jgi:hypothetical protein